jgi:hypothetical protein
MVTELSNLTKLPIIGISNTGHIYDDRGQLGSNWSSISLQEQINHKVKFIENHLLEDQELGKHMDPNQKMNIVFVGHSIGCYVILELLGSVRKDLKSQIKKAILLFPTVSVNAIFSAYKSGLEVFFKSYFTLKSMVMSAYNYVILVSIS